LSALNGAGDQKDRLTAAALLPAGKDVAMYVRTVVMQGTPETADQATKIFAESVIPAAKQQTGFKGALFLTDPTTGRGVSVTLLETEADLKAREGSGYLQEQVAQCGPLLVGLPTREVLVVAAKKQRARRRDQAVVVPPNEAVEKVRRNGGTYRW